MKTSTDTILSASAIVMAFTSICVSVWTGVEARSHNRLSVRPHLELAFNAGSRSLGYTLVNNGLGPARIKSLRITMDGEEISSSSFSGYDGLLQAMGKTSADLVYDAVGAGTVMPSGDSRKILALKHDGAAGQDSLLTAVFTRTAVEIAYESMYEEPFVTRIP